MRIAHLSDLHISSLFKKSQIGKTKKIIERAIESGFDHIVITGDISDNAEEKDYLGFREILKKYDLLDAAKTSITIGNHDIYGGVQTALDVVNFPAKCLAANYEKKVNEFVEYFKELFQNVYFPLQNNFFPYAKVAGDFVLIGLNTIDKYSRLKNPFASNGKVYKDQKEGLKEIFSDQSFSRKRKIVLSHHHFYKNTAEATSSSSVWNKIESYTLKLKGKKKLLKMFKENDVELVLHGHSHEIRDYIRKGIRFLNAGGCIDNAYSENSSLIMIDMNENINVVIHSFDLNKKRIIQAGQKTEYFPSLAG